MLAGAWCCSAWQVNGYWTWMAVHGHGQSHASLPYDCNAGRANWHTGWSGGKKATKSCGGNSGKLAFASSRSRHGAVSTNMSAATEVGRRDVAASYTQAALLRRSPDRPCRSPCVPRRSALQPWPEESDAMHAT